MNVLTIIIIVIILILAGFAIYLSVDEYLKNKDTNLREHEVENSPNW